MLAIQLDFEGRKMVTSGIVPLGELLLEDDLAFGVFSVIQTEYTECYRLIRERIRFEEMRYFVRDAIISGELHVTVMRPDCEIAGLINRAIFPLKSDRMAVSYVKCQKTYVLKPSITWLRKDLQFSGVIK